MALRNIRINDDPILRKNSRKVEVFDQRLQTLIDDMQDAVYHPGWQKDIYPDPGELKDAVCSPGGTTIEGVRALEEGAFRATCMNAVLAALEKTKRLKK